MRSGTQTCAGLSGMPPKRKTALADSFSHRGEPTRAACPPTLVVPGRASWSIEKKRHTFPPDDRVVRDETAAEDSGSNAGALPRRTSSMASRSSRRRWILDDVTKEAPGAERLAARLDDAAGASDGAASIRTSCSRSTGLPATPVETGERAASGGTTLALSRMHRGSGAAGQRGKASYGTPGRCRGSP